MMERTASIKRDTKETRIALTLSLDGTGSADIDTGIGFSTICWTALHGTDFLIYL